MTVGAPRVSGSMCMLVSALLSLVTDAVAGETCMKAVRTKKRSSNNESGHPMNGWRWVNFDCRTGCCGSTSEQYCCPEESSKMKDPTLVAATSVGILLVVLTIIIVVVCCMHCRSRRKQSQRRRRPRHPSASATPSTNSLPPSYEMSIAMSAENSRNAFPAEVHAPPSYEEVMGGSASLSPHSISTHPGASGHARVHGTDNPSFSLTDESESRYASRVS